MITQLRPGARGQIRKQAMRALGFALIGVLVSATASAQNKARYLFYKNCGGYAVDRVDLQEKIQNGWINVKGGTWTGSLAIEEGICFDPYDIYHETDNGTRIYPYRKSGGQFRLRIHIDGGDTENCDGTSYNADSNADTRLLTTKGTTRNNNRCKTIDYKSWGNMNDACTTHGGAYKKKTGQSC